MQTVALNRLVYFCWAAGGNMCLTSVSLARRFATGLHCPIGWQWLISKRTGNYSPINELTFEDGPAHSRAKCFRASSFVSSRILFVLLFIWGLWKGLWIDHSKVNTQAQKCSVSHATPNSPGLSSRRRAKSRVSSGPRKDSETWLEVTFLVRRAAPSYFDSYYSELCNQNTSKQLCYW